MKGLKFFMLAFITIFSLLTFTRGYASEQLMQERLMQEQQMMEPCFEKVYVSPDRVLIYPEGIFYLNESGELASARLVASDASGLYVIATAYRCPACGRYNRTNVCRNKACPLFNK